MFSLCMNFLAILLTKLLILLFILLRFRNGFGLQFSRLTFSRTLVIFRNSYLYFIFMIPTCLILTINALCRHSYSIKHFNINSRACFHFYICTCYIVIILHQEFPESTLDTFVISIDNIQDSLYIISFGLLY